ncbi:hypothetical protein N9R54_05785, partial [Pelobium sp.]|nr:hypothetical protein [Pelobium sp.]
FKKYKPFIFVSSFLSKDFSSSLRILLLIFTLSFAGLKNSYAQVCGTSGLDGPQNAVPPVNTYFPLGTSTTLTAGSKTITLLAVPPNDPNYNLSYGVTPIKSGDLILIIQMQDANIDYSNTDKYGSGSSTSGPDNLGGTGYTSLGNSGKFEYIVATSDVPITGGTLKFRGAGTGGGCVNTYTNSVATTTKGQSRFQVVRVPQYSNLVLTANITTPPYNGSVGGLIAFDVAGTMQFNGFIVDASERGFRGGYGPNQTGNPGLNKSNIYVIPSSDTRSVGKGEGIAGTPRYMWDGFNQVNNGVEGLPSGSYGRGAPANAGGGGNDHNSGGGGGGNGGFGGLGGAGWQGGGGDLFSNGLTGGGRPGSNLPVNVSALTMGGGGGGGDANNATSGVKGGVGGGIILINVDKIDGVGVVKANGGIGQAGAFGSAPDGAGGGGAGGSIFVRSLAASPTANLTLEAKGGNGGNTINDGGNEHGPGGGGGGGFIYTQVPSATITTNVTKGTAGKSNNGAGITHGAQDGLSGSTKAFATSDLPIYLTGGGSICYPALDVVLSELNAGPTGARAAGTTATYKLMVTNNVGGGNAGDVNVDFLLPYGFSLSNVTATVSGDVAGPTSPTFTAGATGNITFGTYNISPGDYVEFTISVNIASNAPLGIYHASAQVRYLDPTRTVANPLRKITANNNSFAGSNTTYESGGVGNVPGTNYNGDLLTATAEDVYINAPLPTGDCNAVVNGDFSASTIGEYGSPSYMGSWTVVNSGDKVKVMSSISDASNLVAYVKDGYSLKQTVFSINPSANYTLSFDYVKNNVCGNTSSASKIQVQILDAVSLAVLATYTPANATSSPQLGTIAFTTNSTTNSIIIQISDNGSPSNACAVLVDNVTITSPLAITTSKSNVTCNGLSNGSISITAMANAAPPYKVSYSSNGGVSYSSPVNSGVLTTSDIPINFTGLSAGSYIIKVVDQNGCTTTRNITINEPNLLTLSGTNSTILCNGSTSTVTLTASGGTTPYQYSIDGGLTYQTQNTFPGLSAGTYNFLVKDVNSCTATTSVSFTQPIAINLSESHTAILCNSGTSNVTLTASGGTGTLSYSNGGLTYQSSNTFNGLVAGNYTFYVKDVNDCVKTIGINITEPDVLTLSSTNTSILCNAGIATVTLTATGGTSTYQYSKDGINFQNSNVFNVGAGTYTFTVKDVNNCTATAGLILTEPTALTLTGSATSILCNGNKSTVTLTAGGGTGTYQYSKDGSTYQVSEIFNNLSGGSYTFYVKDANGCTKTFPINIAEPDALAIVETHQNINCFGDATGSIDATINGGTLPYTFTWSNGATILNQSNLPAGTYILNVTDANNCSISKSITITQPVALAVNASKFNVKCYGEKTGFINVTISGGVPPYTYNWSNGATTEDLINIPAGSYSLEVTDSNGCLLFTPVINITQPAAPLTLTETHINNTCFAQNAGSIDLSVSGGVTPYLYSWSSGQTTQDISSLAPGNYTVTVTDKNLCTATLTVTITPLAPFTVSESKTDIKCFSSATGEITLNLSGGTLPYQVIWNNGATTSSIQNLAAGTYTYTTTDNNGCQISNSITITQPTILNLSENHTNILCNGGFSKVTLTANGGTGVYQYSKDGSIYQASNEFDNLPAGSYTFYVKDANDCIKTLPVTISEPTLLTLTGNNTPILCNSGVSKVTLTANGGTGVYQYSKDGSIYQASNEFDNLTAGNYTFYVKDGNACSKTVSISITEPTLLTLTGNSTPINCNGGVSKVTLTANGGTGVYQYSKDGISYQASNEFDNLVAGNYTFKVKDANSCSADFILSITEPAALILAASSKTDATCNGTSTGSVTAGTVTNAVGSISYSWKNSSNVEVGTTATVNNLPAGTYTLTVSDNCFIRSNSVTIDEPAALILAPSTKTDATCNGTPTGSVTAGTVTNAVGSVSYSWKNSSNVEVGTTATVPNLPAGTYTLTVTDNCFTRSNSVTIDEPAALSLAASSKTDATCNGTSTGSVTAGTVTNAVGIISYSWKNGSNIEVGTTATVNNLPAGTYTLTVSDNCFTRSNSVTINEPAALSLAASSKTDATCNGTSTGSVTAGTVTNAVGTISYSWKNSSNVEVGTTATVPNLPAGTYTLTVSDNCFTRNNSVTIDEPAALILAASSKTDAICNGTPTGSITAGAVTNAVGTISYSWKNSSNVEVGTTATVNNLPAGTYTLTVSDNCFSRTNTVTITEPAALSLAASSKTDATCNGTS